MAAITAMTTISLASGRLPSKRIMSGMLVNRIINRLMKRYFRSPKKRIPTHMVNGISKKIITEATNVRFLPALLS